MNQIIDTLLDHRSIRNFKDIPLSKEQIHTIVSAAQSASTSSYMMAYTIIGVTDETIKQEIADVSGQPYVRDNGHLMIFCADLHRAISTADEPQYKKALPNLENSEHFLVSVIDAALAAQNAATAAESMDLGICYIGSIRNNISKIDELLSLPTHVIPLFGMVFGVPDEQPQKKPRLPVESVYFENSYQLPDETLKKFDDKIQSYYQSRQTNQRTDSWTSQMLRRFSNPIRMDVTEFVQKKGFNRR